MFEQMTEQQAREAILASVKEYYEMHKGRQGALSGRGADSVCLQSL